VTLSDLAKLRGLSAIAKLLVVYIFAEIQLYIKPNLTELN